MDIRDLKINLESSVWNSDKVIIVPHNGIDFDAIGSAIGLSVIVSNLERDSYIVYDKNKRIDGGICMIMDEASSRFNIIEIEKYLDISCDNDLFIMTDVNKKNLISISDMMTNPDKVFIIDHHEIDDNTVLSNNMYIDTNVSSASEVVTNLLEEFRFSIPEDVSNYLLAGIYLDTNKLTNKNVSPHVMEVAGDLLRWGANMNTINDYFSEDFMSDRRVQNLVNKLVISTYNIAIMLADDNEIYTKEELAKASDYALKYKVDLSFAVGHIDKDTIRVSARSREVVDVSLIMKRFGGGGNHYSAASEVRNSSLEDVGKKLVKILNYSC